MGARYQVFLSNSTLYGFKGIVGMLAPIGVHGALLLKMTRSNDRTKDPSLHLA